MASLQWRRVRKGVLYVAGALLIFSTAGQVLAFRGCSRVSREYSSHVIDDYRNMVFPGLQR